MAGYVKLEFSSILEFTTSTFHEKVLEWPAMSSLGLSELLNTACTSAAAACAAAAAAAATWEPTLSGFLLLLLLLLPHV